MGGLLKVLDMMERRYGISFRDMEGKKSAAA
jgi:hypothetical protein